MPDDHIVLFEPHFAGHRMQYCRWLADWITERGETATLATSNGTFGSVEYLSRFEARPVDLVNLGERQNVGTRKYQRWVLQQLRNVLRGYPRARVVVLEGDKFLPYLWLIRRSDRKRLTLLVMRAPAPLIPLSAYSMKSAFKRGILRIAALQTRVRVLAPSRPRQDEYTWRKLRATPDPVELVTTLGPKEPTSSATSFVMGVFGAINPRKNVPVVIDAFVEGTAPGAAELRILGKIRSSHAPTVEKHAARAREAGFTVNISDRFLSEEELEREIHSADLTVAAYSNDAPSGILGKSVALGTTVLLGDSPVLREAASCLGDLATTAPITREGLADEMKRLMSRQAHLRSLGPLQLADSGEFARALIGEHAGQAR